MSGLSDQLHMQDVPDHVLLLPTQTTLISPEEQQKELRYLDTNGTKETHDDSSGDYSYITVWKTYLCSEKNWW